MEGKVALRWEQKSYLVLISVGSHGSILNNGVK